MATLWAVSDLHTGSHRQQAGHRVAAPVVAGRLADRRGRRRRAHRRDPVGTRPAAQAVRQGHLGAGQPRTVDHHQGSDAGVRPGALRLPGQHVRRDGRGHPRASLSGVDRRRWPRHDRADVPALRLHVLARGGGDEGRGAGHRQGAQRGGHRRVRALQRAVCDEGRVVPRPGGDHPQAARGPRLGDADGSGEPLPAGARTLRCAVLPGVLAVVRHHRHRRLAHPLQRDLLGLRTPAHSANHVVRRRALRRGVGRLSA